MVLVSNLKKHPVSFLCVRILAPIRLFLIGCSGCLCSNWPIPYSIHFNTPMSIQLHLHPLREMFVRPSMRLASIGTAMPDRGRGRGGGACPETTQAQPPPLGSASRSSRSCSSSFSSAVSCAASCWALDRKLIGPGSRHLHRGPNAESCA